MASLALMLLVLATAGALRPATPEPLTGAVVDSASSSPTPGGESASVQTSRSEPVIPTTKPSAVVARSSHPATPKPSGCKPTDQDRYVYNPSRLAVQAACIHVTGTVDAIRTEADGDLHILLSLDPPYAHLLTPANQGEELGDLVVEPVCVRHVTQADAIGVCAADPDPFGGPFPAVGSHIWMEGRYVFDLDHGGWAELHPLYRWGYQ